jgi:YesN/AraC family two-component response regulator
MSRRFAHSFGACSRGAGYDLIVAKSGDEALALANDHTGAIDLLVTDVVMPRMNGFELGGYIGGAHPETSVLFLSGYTPRTRRRSGRD